MSFELAEHDLLASLAAIGHSLQEAFDPQRFLVDFSEHLQCLVPHDRLLIVYREEGDRLSVFSEHARRGPLLHEGRYTIDFDPAGRYTPAELRLESVLAGDTMVVRDFQDDPRLARLGVELAKAMRIGLRARVAVPFASGRRIIGALLAGSFTPDAYAEAHVAAARQVADLIGPFIENVILLQRERRRPRRLQALEGLAHALGTSLNVRDVFNRLADATRPILDFDVMGVALISTSGRDVEMVAEVDDAPTEETPPRIPLEHFSFSGKVEAGKDSLINKGFNGNPELI